MNNSILSQLPQGYRFHHIGYATNSIKKEMELLTFIGYKIELATFSDSTQGVCGCFLIGTGPRLELLENLPGRKTLTPWLQAGIKMYHFAYEVNDMDEALRWATNHKGKVIVRPTPAVAFSGRNISFIMFREGLLIELIEIGS